MASNTLPSSQRTGSRRSPRGMLWMSERQLDAYLQTKEALRRVRAVASSPPGVANADSPGRSA